jgi:transketolase
MTTAVEQSAALAARIRERSLRMVYRARASHIGSSLSMADLLAVLYSGVLRVDPKRPGWPGRDRLLVSKGHAAAALYAVLAETGFFPVEELDTYCEDGSRLLGHVSHHVPGVELSTGSLGHGLPVGGGLALAAKKDAAPWRVYVLLSDGELDEGSVWEQALLAPQLGLDNLVAIIDYNKIQSFGSTAAVADLEPLAAKWRAFRWGVRECDGHDHSAIESALRDLPYEPGRPSVLIAHTIKGKGVSFMEGELAWHYRSPDLAQLARALEELER